VAKSQNGLLRIAACFDADVFRRLRLLTKDADGQEPQTGEEEEEEGEGDEEEKAEFDEILERAKMSTSPACHPYAAAPAVKGDACFWCEREHECAMRNVPCAQELEADCARKALFACADDADRMKALFGALFPGTTENKTRTAITAVRKASSESPDASVPRRSEQMTQVEASKDFCGDCRSRVRKASHKCHVKAILKGCIVAKARVNAETGSPKRAPATPPSPATKGPVGKQVQRLAANKRALEELLEGPHRKRAKAPVFAQRRPVAWDEARLQELLQDPSEDGAR